VLPQKPKPLALNPSRNRPSRTPDTPTLTLKPAAAAHVFPLHQKRAKRAKSVAADGAFMHTSDCVLSVAKAACGGMPIVTAVDRARQVGTLKPSRLSTQNQHTQAMLRTDETGYERPGVGRASPTRARVADGDGPPPGQLR
jgi:hypothetical protein